MTRRAALLVGALVLLGGASQVHADETGPSAAGWWWFVQQAPAGGVAVPPPPTVPPGGLYVASDASQTQAISALRYALQDGATATTLTLDIADVKGIGEVGACPAAGDWEPVEAGDWNARPSFDCSAAVVGAVSADGTAISFDMTKLPPRSSVDVVLVPLRDASGTSPVLQMAFDPPAPSSLTYRPPAPEQSSVSSSGDGPAPASSDPRPSAASSFEIGPPIVPSPGAAPLSALSNPVAAAQPRLVPRATPVATSAINDYDFGESTRFQLIATLLAMNLTAAAAWSRSLPRRIPKLLGPQREGGDQAARMSDRVEPVSPAERTAEAPGPAHGLGRYRAPRPVGARRYL